MTDPSVAGKLISKLSNMRVEPAVNTDRLFGRILAEAALIMYRQARRDGLPEGVPICLGGKPAYALPYFGPSAQRRLGAAGRDELSAALGDRRARTERQPGRRRRAGREDRPADLKADATDYSRLPKTHCAPTRRCKTRASEAQQATLFLELSLWLRCKP